MCEALRELMKDEIDKEVADAVEKAVETIEINTTIKTRFEDGMPIEKIAEKSNMSVEEVKEILEKLGLIEEAKIEK